MKTADVNAINKLLRTFPKRMLSMKAGMSEVISLGTSRHANGPWKQLRG